MGSKTILKKTGFGDILAKQKGESMKEFARRQTEEFERANKRRR